MGRQVECEVEYDLIEDDNGRKGEGVRLTCGDCDHETESFGQTDRSIRRCLALMRETCPEGEENYYVADD